MTENDILKKAEKVAQNMKITKGTWYVVKATPSDAGVPNGYFLMIPNDHGDAIILIDIENGGKSHFVHLSKFLDIEMIGVVREGKADEKVWV